MCGLSVGAAYSQESILSRIEIKGFWDVRAGFTAGWRFDPSSGSDTPIFTTIVPGLSATPLLQNSVDLSVSIWLYDRLSIEGNFSDADVINSLVIGYEGKEDEVVQYARIGYGDFSIRTSLPLSIENPNGRSAGLALQLNSPFSRHEIAARYAHFQPHHIRYRGNRPLTSQFIEFDEYVRGRFFLFPDGEVRMVEIYVESNQGTIRGVDTAGISRLYEQIDIAEYGHYNETNGTLTFDHAADQRVLVYYTTQKGAVGDPQLGRDVLYQFSDGMIDTAQPRQSMNAETHPELFETLTNGRRALLLYRPGYFSHFEMLNRYHTSVPFDTEEDLFDSQGELRVRFQFTNRTSGNELQIGRKVIYTTVDSGIIAVEVKQSVPSGDHDQERLNQYPFAAEYPHLYRMAHRRSAQHDVPLNVQIEVQQLGTPGAAAPPPGVDRRSVTAVRNRRIDPLFFNSRIAAGDLIDLYYYTIENQGGDLSIMNTNQFFPADNLTLSLDTGLRWNLLGTRYTTQPFTNSGTFALSGGGEWHYEGFAVAASGAFQLSHPDTTNYLRLLGMEEQTTIVPITSQNILPAAPPATTATSVTPLRHAQRGKLLYRDYRSNTPERYLLRYDASVGPAHDYTAHGYTGPYLAATGAETVGNAAVFEFDLAANEWAGGYIATSAALPAELDGIGEIEFEWRGIELTGDIDVRIEIGAVGEDIDADNRLDEGAPSRGGSLLFNTDTLPLYAGLPQSDAAFTHTEDIDRNGVLDREDAALIYTSHNIAAQGIPTERWNKVRIPLRTEDRVRLRNVRGIRIVVRNRAAAAARGRLLFSTFTLNGNTLHAEIDSGTIDLYETENDLPKGAPAIGGTRMLAVRWDSPSSAATPPRWRIRSPITPVPRRLYRTLAFYLRSDQIVWAPSADSAADTMVIEILDPSTGRGIMATLDGAAVRERIFDRAWHLIELDMVSNEVKIDGNAAAAISRNDPGNYPLSLFRLTLRGAASGTLFLDEVHWRDAQLQFDGAAALDASWKYPESIWEVGGYSLFGNIRIAQEIDFRTLGYHRAPITSTGEILGSTSEPVGTLNYVFDFGIDLLGIRLEEKIRLITDFIAAPISTFSHTIRIPSFDFPLVVTDRFRHSTTGGKPDIYRANSILFMIDTIGSWRFDTETIARDPTLQQRWSLRQNAWWDFPFVFDWQVSLFQNGRYELPFSDTTFYPLSWLESYQYFIPLFNTDNLFVRGGAFSADFDLYLLPHHIDLDIDLSYRITTSSAPIVQANAASIDLGVPLTFGSGTFEEWSLTPRYARYYESHVPNRRLSFAGDIETYLLYNGPRSILLLTAIPIYELFAPAIAQDFENETTLALSTKAAYRPQFTLDFQRPQMSTWIDLLVPISAQFQFTRELTRTNTLIDDLRTIRLTVTMRALNLFGAFGTYQLTDLYTIDDILNTFGTAVTLDADAIPRARFDVAQHLRLIGNRNEEFLLRHDLRIETAQGLTEIWDTIALSYRWSGEQFTIFDLPPSFLSHTEKFSFSTTPRYQNYPTNLFTFVVDHETRLHFDTIGSIGIDFALSVSFQQLTPRARTIIGIQGGISGRLQF